MRKIILILCCMLIANIALGNDFNLNRISGLNPYYSDTIYEKSFLNDITHCENIVFKRSFKKDEIAQRLERLEIMLFGAVQNGANTYRLSKIKKATTNISQGGWGLHNNLSNSFSLVKSSSIGYNNKIGSDYYSNYRPEYNRYNPYNRNHIRGHYPPPPRHSSPSIINGNNAIDYDMGTSIHILRD